MTTCLSCCELLRKDESYLHTKCRRQLFGNSKVNPVLDLTRQEIIQQVREKSLRMSLGGAQPKASLGIKKVRLEILATAGEYLLKPSNDLHPEISENEHFCMNIVKKAGLPVPAFTLIELVTGEKAFLVKRFDREKKDKFHLEDFASALNLMTDNKYDSNYLDVLMIAHKYCRDSGYEKINIFKLIVLSFLLGNNDLHLKNFSLLDRGRFYQLSPVYDVVCARLYYPESSEMALELAPDYLGSLATKGYYTKTDFLHLANLAGLSKHQSNIVIKELINLEPQIYELLTQSYLSLEFKRKIKHIIQEQYCKFAS